MAVTTASDATLAQELDGGLRGRAIGPNDPSYDQARAVWNGSIDRRPTVVAECLGVADIRSALEVARHRDLPIAVRGGGHNVAGFGTCDEGMVIDLGPMCWVRVDPQARTATVGPGVLGRDLDHETQQFGLATTLGVMSTTGVTGLTLGGGIGWLQRKLGLACDNLRHADMVTTDGDLVHASETENPELFWGLRGGGGNFGIVTSLTFDLHPVGPEVLCGLVAWPASEAADVLGFFDELMAEAPDELGVVAICRTAPPAPFIPEDLHGEPIVALAACYAGDVRDGEEVLSPLRSFGDPAGDALAVRPYAQFQAMFDGSWEPGFQNYWKAEHLVGLPPEARETLAWYAENHTSPLSDFKVAAMGGAVSRVGEQDTACPHRDAPFVLNINTRWSDPAESDHHIAHTRELFGAMQIHSAGGTFLNFLGDEGPERTRHAYVSNTFERLRALKDTWDPDNVLRLNQNVPPSSA